MRPFADRRSRSQRDVRRQILVLRAKCIAHPGTDRREPRETAAGDESELRRGMVDTVGGHGPDESHLVDHLLEIRKQLGHLAATVAAVSEFPGTGHDLLRAVQRAALDFEWRRFA